jgi:hypothetical protein
MLNKEPSFRFAAGKAKSGNALRPRLDLQEITASAGTRAALKKNLLAGLTIYQTGETMAIEGTSATVPLSPGQRLEGLNRIAELRASVFGLNIEPELERFIKDMRDRRDINHKQNERALAAIFFMAKIPAERHGVNISDLTTDEKRELVKAMNHFRAVVSLFSQTANHAELIQTEI